MNTPTPVEASDSEPSPHLTSPRPKKWKDWRVAGPGIVLLYGIAYTSLYQFWGMATVGFYVGPILVLASMFGMRGGLIVGLFGAPLNTLLFLIHGDYDYEFFSSPAFYFVTIGYIFVGIFVGNLSQVRDQLQDELERRLAIQRENEKLIGELRNALDRVKTLSGLLPICSNCKKVRKDGGYWQQIETYIRDHSEAQFSHGICPQCAMELYPECFHPDHGLEEP